ncbi:MAG TPA: CRTAC1 family protein [Gemmataceae bacterium]|nr:CRTAC1 family protein [Gemmataceae bacterium]
MTNILHKEKTLRTWRRTRFLLLGLAVILVGGSVILLSLKYFPGFNDNSKSNKSSDVPRVTFRDITNKAGIRFTHTNGAFGKKLLPETMGSGVAFLDFDNDGKPDLLFINSCHWPGHQPSGEPAPTLALYRNKGNLEFEDVTEACGLKISLYGMGVTVGDYDNDGWPDIFITAVGGNHLFHNQPVDPKDPAKGRHFVEVTSRAGVGGPGGWPTGSVDFLQWDKPISFSTSATFLDYDGDGLLDLFVCNYITWSPAADLSQDFKLMGGGRAYGPPTYFEGAQCLLYRNKGGGQFEDVSYQTGVAALTKGRNPLRGKSLGVVACDVDEDGWPDLFVANDTAPNFFFHNEPVDPKDPSKGRHFVEIAKRAGIVTADGSARGAMGVDWGECRPGVPAFLVGNFADEPDSLFTRDFPKRLLFSDSAQLEGIAFASKPWLKFGAFFFDYDLDGRLDLFTCNGHLEPDIATVRPTTYQQPAQLFWNNGHARQAFELVKTEDAGDDIFLPMVGRSCAFADIDGDGYLDLVVTANGGPARLLHNEGQSHNNWIRLKLEGDGKRSNRSAIGARVIVKSGDQVQQREVVAGRGYLSQSELTLTFGLGQKEKIESITVHWPGREASLEEFGPLPVNKEHVLQQGRSSAR